MLSIAALLFSANNAAIPTMKIAVDVNGKDVNLPLSGLGTWQYNDTRAEAAALLALSVGYTHIDTALGYGNQEGIAKALKASGRSRDSYFITSKIPGGLPNANATAQLELSLSQLDIDYVDLMLVHYPASWGGVGGKELRQEQWKALEAFYKAGKTRAIGVSHYCENHIADILEIATVLPAVNQVQYHVGMAPPKNHGLNATDMPVPTQLSGQPSYAGIVYQPFSSLCGPCGTTELIDGPIVVGIGKKYSPPRSGAQVSLRYLIQRGMPVIPKSDNKAYLMENIDLFDWSLTAGDMMTLDNLASPPVAGDPDGSSGDCKVA
jgi:diketogulonate reductase-like aldo/keto reductase